MNANSLEARCMRGDVQTARPVAVQGANYNTELT